MFHRRKLRSGAWLALLAILSGLLAPLGAHARLPVREDGTLRAPVCTSAATADAAGLGAALLSGDDAPVPAPERHAGAAACVYCQAGPAALPAPDRTGATAPGIGWFVRIAIPRERGERPQGSWPPLPARGPPSAA